MRSKTNSRAILFLSKPVNAFLFALLTYFLLASLGGSPFRVREQAYFNYLADAFLHGQLQLRLIPSSVGDLSLVGGKYYLYWPPMPAVVLMPFVAIFGVNFSDVFFNLLVAAANVSMVSAVLREAEQNNLISLGADMRSWLVLFFALGTTHVAMSIPGQVWLTGQLVGFLFLASAYYSALRLRGSAAFAVTGVLIACAMLSRSHMLFAGVWPLYHLLKTQWDERKKLLANLILFTTPLAIFGTLFLLYNRARFGSPFDLGVEYQLMSPVFAADFAKYGLFSAHYVPINFYYQYLAYPLPLSAETLMGGSLFLLSPLFFYAFYAVLRDRKDAQVWALAASTVLTSIPILFVMGTGWIQYGPRYTMDFTMPLLLLTARGVQFAPRRVVLVLIALSVAQYIPGILIMTLR